MKTLLLLFFALNAFAQNREVVFLGPPESQELQAWKQIFSRQYTNTLTDIESVEGLSPSVIILGEKRRPSEFFFLRTRAPEFFLKPSLVYVSANKPIKKWFEPSDEKNARSLEEFLDQEESRLNEAMLTEYINELVSPGDFRQWNRIFPNALVIGYSDAIETPGIQFKPEEFISQVNGLYREKTLGDFLATAIDSVAASYRPANSPEFRIFGNQWKNISSYEFAFSSWPQGHSRNPGENFYKDDISMTPLDIFQEILAPNKVRFFRSMKSDPRSALFLFYLSGLNLKTDKTIILNSLATAFDELLSRNQRWWDNLNDETLSNVYAKVAEILLDKAEDLPSGYFLGRLRRAMRDPNPEIRGVTVELLDTQTALGNPALPKDELLRHLSTAVNDLSPRVRQAAFGVIIQGNFDLAELKREFDSAFAKERDPDIIAEVKRALNARNDRQRRSSVL